MRREQCPPAALNCLFCCRIHFIVRQQKISDPLPLVLSTSQPNLNQPKPIICFQHLEPVHLAQVRQGSYVVKDYESRCQILHLCRSVDQALLSRQVIDPARQRSGSFQSPVSLFRVPHTMSTCIYEIIIPIVLILTLQAQFSLYLDGYLQYTIMLKSIILLSLLIGKIVNISVENYNHVCLQD